jgi:hypothetical protein
MLGEGGFASTWYAVLGLLYCFALSYIFLRFFLVFTFPLPPCLQFAFPYFPCVSCGGFDLNSDVACSSVFSFSVLSYKVLCDTKTAPGPRPKLRVSPGQFSIPSVIKNLS